MFNFDKEKKMRTLESEHCEETEGEKCLKKQLRDIFFILWGQSEFATDLFGAILGLCVK